MTSHARRLGHHVAALRVEDLPADVLERLACCLLYNLSVALAGVDAGVPARTAIRAVHDAHGPARLLGEHTRRSAADAAAINAALVTARGQNDTHADFNGHAGCLVVPAVLALAEARDASAEDIVAALAAGYEIAPRIGKGAAAAAMAAGWRGTSLFGIFGVAAACARLVRLDAEATAHALSLAANAAGGLVRCYAEGTPEWAFQVAHASRSGLQAALLAERGLTAASEVLEGTGGFFGAIGVAPSPPETDGWRIRDVSFKPFPGCAINQIPTQMLLAWLERTDSNGRDVESVALGLNPAHARYPGVDAYGPFSSPAAAIMSAPFMLELALEHGAPRHADFTDRFGEDPLHVRSRRVRVDADPALEPFECTLAIRTVDGVQHVERARGASVWTPDWTATRSLSAALAAEWSSMPADAQPRLVDAVGRCIHVRDAGAPAALFDALIPPHP